MTICEAFRNSYMDFKQKELEERAKEQNGEFSKYRINLSIEVGTKQFVETYFKEWDAFYDYQLTKMGITEQQIHKAVENGYCQIKSYTNWEARQLGQTRAIRITAKGIKALYKAYKGQW